MIWLGFRAWLKNGGTRITLLPGEDNQAAGGAWMSSKTLKPVPDSHPEVGLERQHRAEKWLDTEIEECPGMDIYSQYWLQMVGYSHLQPGSTLR